MLAHSWQVRTGAAPCCKTSQGVVGQREVYHLEGSHRRVRQRVDAALSERKARVRLRLFDPPELLAAPARGPLTRPDLMTTELLSASSDGVEGWPRSTAPLLEEITQHSEAGDAELIEVAQDERVDLGFTLLEEAATGGGQLPTRSPRHGGTPYQVPVGQASEQEVDRLRRDVQGTRYLSRRTPGPVGDHAKEAVLRWRETVGTHGRVEGSLNVAIDVPHPDDDLPPQAGKLLVRDG
jgi:hypothetical protein